MMTRPKILFVVSALTIFIGAAWLWSFLSPVFDPTKPKVLNPVEIIFSVAFLLVGWGLFRRNKFALEIGFWLWFVSLIWNSLATAFLFAQISTPAVPRNILAIVFLLILLVVHLLVVIFLSQKETKKLFILDSSNSAEATSKSEMKV